MTYPLTTKIFTSLALLVTVAIIPTAQAAFWAQQQTVPSENSGKAQAMVTGSKPIAKAIPKHSVSAVAKKQANVPITASKKVNALTLEQVLEKQRGLTETQQIQLWQRYLQSPAITPCGKIMAYGNLGELQANLNQYSQSLQAYEQVLTAFPADQCANGSFLIAASLNGTGYVLGKLERKAEALDYFKSVPRLYSIKKYPDLKSVNLSALSNTAEVSLIVGNKAQALEYAEKANELTSKNDDTYAIMPFVLWLMKHKTEQDVLKAINHLAPDTEYSWDWRDIPPVIKQLPAKRQAKANCFIDFFDKHHDKARVKACVAQY